MARYGGWTGPAHARVQAGGHRHGRDDEGDRRGRKRRGLPRIRLNVLEPSHWGSMRTPYGICWILKGSGDSSREIPQACWIERRIENPILAGKRYEKSVFNPRFQPKPPVFDVGSGPRQVDNDEFARWFFAQDPATQVRHGRRGRSRATPYDSHGGSPMERTERRLSRSSARGERRATSTPSRTTPIND